VVNGVASGLTIHVGLLFSLLLAPVLMGVARICLIYFFVDILIIVLWLRDCPDCENLLCIVGGTGSGMLSGLRSPVVYCGRHG
jgi:hypothetical protein